MDNWSHRETLVRSNACCNSVSTDGKGNKTVIEMDVVRLLSEVYKSVQ